MTKTSDVMIFKGVLNPETPGQPDKLEATLGSEGFSFQGLEVLGKHVKLH